MFRWYAVNTYSGHEKKVKANLEQRIHTLDAERHFRRVVIPTESVVETKEGKKIQIEKRTMPGYVLVNMDLTDDSWFVVKGTPGVIAFVGPQTKPVPLSQPEVDRLLHVEHPELARRTTATYTLGEAVKVTSGPLADFDGEVVEVNEDQRRLKVMVSIFERQVPVELDFEQVRKSS